MGPDVYVSDKGKMIGSGTLLTVIGCSKHGGSDPSIVPHVVLVQPLTERPIQCYSLYDYSFEIKAT